MTTCTIIGIIVHCVALSPLPPAEAAAIVAPGARPAIVATEHVTPGVFVTHSRVTDGPYGAFPPQPPARRLDGTPLNSPVTVYGAPLFYGYDGVYGNQHYEVGIDRPRAPRGGRRR